MNICYEKERITPNVLNRIIYTAFTACLLLSTHAQASNPFSEKIDTTKAISTFPEINWTKVRELVPQLDQEVIKNNALSMMQSCIKIYEPQFNLGQFIRIEERKPSMGYSQQFCSTPVHMVCESAGGPPPKLRYTFTDEDITLSYPKEKFFYIEKIEPLPKAKKIIHFPVAYAVKQFVGNDHARNERQNLVIRLLNNDKGLTVQDEAVLIVGLKKLLTNKKQATFFQIQFNDFVISESHLNILPTELMPLILGFSSYKDQIAVARTCKNYFMTVFQIKKIDLLKQIEGKIRDRYPSECFCPNSICAAINPDLYAPKFEIAQLPKLNLWNLRLQFTNYLPQADEGYNSPSLNLFDKGTKKSTNVLF